MCGIIPKRGTPVRSSTSSGLRIRLSRFSAAKVHAIPAPSPRRMLNASTSEVLGSTGLVGSVAGSMISTVAAFRLATTPASFSFFNKSS